MMKTSLIFRPAFYIIVFTACSEYLHAQTEQPALTATILHLDSAFWNAYNNCDTARFKDFVTDSVEFYHDKGGITLGAKALIESLDKNICGSTDHHIRRAAVAGTVHVYPMQNGNEIYGAVISGQHSFYIADKGRPEYHSGDANFTQLWMLKNGTWKMSRILSYNHHATEYINTRKETELPAAQIDVLAGKYKSAQFGMMTVTRSNKLLLLKSSNNTFTLYPASNTTFFSKERDLVFEFVKDAAGKPVKMIVKENGAVADELVFQK